MTDIIQTRIKYILTLVISFSLIGIIKNKFIKILIVIICIFTLIFFNFQSGWSVYPKYFEFKSPDGDIIIVEECSWLFGGWSNVYQKTDTYTVHELDGFIITDDGYRPFSRNDYHLEWTENTLYIDYGIGSNSVREDITYKLIR